MSTKEKALPKTDRVRGEPPGIDTLKWKIHLGLLQKKDPTLKHCWSAAEKEGNKETTSRFQEKSGLLY